MAKDELSGARPGEADGVEAEPEEQGLLGAEAGGGCRRRPALHPALRRGSALLSAAAVVCFIVACCRSNRIATGVGRSRGHSALATVGLNEQVALNERGKRSVVLAHFLENSIFNALYVERVGQENNVNGRETYWSHHGYFLYWCQDMSRWLLGWDDVFPSVQEGKCNYAAAGPPLADILDASAATGWSEYVAAEKRMAVHLSAGVETVNFHGEQETLHRQGNFTAADKWPVCADRQLSNVRVQTHACNNCWAMSAARVMEWHLCIRQQDKFRGASAFMSAGYLTQCARDAFGQRNATGCDGGSPLKAMRWVAQHGLPTGGDGSNMQTCVPNFINGLKGALAQRTGGGTEVPPCPTACTNDLYNRSLKEDLFVPEGWNESWATTSFQSATKAIKEAGPIVIGFKVNPWFRKHYERDTIYRYTKSSQPDMDFNHLSIADGFGLDYLEGSNSWGLMWGDAGRFRIHRDSVDAFIIPGPMKGVGEGYPYPLQNNARRGRVSFKGFRQSFLNGIYTEIVSRHYAVHNRSSFLKTTQDLIMYWCPLVPAWAITRIEALPEMRREQDCRYWAISPPDQTNFEKSSWTEFDGEALTDHKTRNNPVNTVAFFPHP